MKSLTFYLESNYEKEALNVPDRVKDSFPDHKFFMQHQIDTYNSNNDFDVTLNTYHTGTGKTKASLLHLLDTPKESALFIAPTNELISQHVRDIKSFIDEAKLEFHVIELNAKVIDKLMEKTELPRRGELLYRLLSNPRNKDFAEALKIDEKYLNSKLPYILVTNPDIFYYAITSNYSYHDKRNIFQAFFGTFNYIIVDEFHYYNSKQLAAFLFFMSLSLSFGHFKTGKRMSILTATPLPEVMKYFERLKEKGLNYKLLESENISEYDTHAKKTLAKAKITFYPLDSFNTLKAVKENFDFIKAKIDNNYDGVIISNSLVTINDTARFLKDNGFESKLSLITGIVKQSSKLPLILATPTVDIGYNFDKDNKDRQNIDYLLFDFRYIDEFWQRLGRAGRVLGKTNLEEISEIIVFASSDEISKLSEFITQEEIISRFKLKDILEKNEILQKRADLTDYLNFYGISEFAKPLEELRHIMSKELESIVIDDLFNTISNVFSGKERNEKQYYRLIRAFNDRYNNLEKAKKDISSCNRKILNDFLVGCDKESMIARIDENTFKLFIKSPDVLSNLENYIKEEFFIIKGLHSFRESFQSLTAFVYDPDEWMGSDKKYFSYDLFHLLQHYEIKFFKSKSEFLKETGYLGEISSKDKDFFYCQIEKRKDDTSLSISFSIDTEMDLDTFEEKYLNKLIAKNNIEFKLNQNEKTGKYQIPMNHNLIVANQAFKEKYIPCIIMNSELASICFKYKMQIKDLDVRGKNYKMLVGTNAYLLAPKIDRIRNMFERKTKCYIC